MILHLLCPTLRNSDSVRRQIMSHRSHSSSDTILWYCVQDEETAKVMQELGHETFITSDRHPTAVLWQKLSDHAGSGNHMLLGDDVIFFEKGWDRAMLSDSSDPLLMNCENLKPDLSTEISKKKLPAPHYCVNEVWRKVTGWFVPPLFKHYCVDSWSMRIAIVTGTLLSCETSRIIHDRKNKISDVLGEDSQIMDKSFQEFSEDCLKIARHIGSENKVSQRLHELRSKSVWHDHRNFLEYIS